MRSHLKHPYQEEVEVDYWKITVVAFKNAMIKRINKNSYETFLSVIFLLLITYVLGTNWLLGVPCRGWGSGTIVHLYLWWVGCQKG